MKLSELWQSRARPSLSLELFPPRSAKAAENLERTLDELLSTQPDFVSVTFGAGGSTREGSYRLVARLKRDKRQEVLAYLAGCGLAPGDITAVLDGYRDLGIDNLLLVRGDLPKDEPDYQPCPEGFEHASDLVTFARPRYPFCLGVAGYPEGHVESSSLASDLEFLRLKVTAGADFIIANYCYDNRRFFEFVERCRAAGIQVPIVPGIMPIYSIKLMESLATTCGATITEQVRAGLAAVPQDDKEAVAAFGIRFAIQQCRELLVAGVRGLHIYTMDRSASAIAIVKQLREEGLL